MAKRFENPESQEQQELNDTYKILENMYHELIGLLLDAQLVKAKLHKAVEKQVILEDNISRLRRKLVHACDADDRLVSLTKGEETPDAEDSSEDS